MTVVGGVSRELEWAVGCNTENVEYGGWRS